MSDFSTSLTAAMNRAVSGVVDSIARDGLQTLKNVLDRSGFASSPYLKNYEVYSHVSGSDITFEILLDSDAVQPSDKAALDDMKQQQEQVQKAQESQQFLENVARTYGLTSRGPQLLLGRRDARKPTKSAMKPSRSALRSSEERLAGHEMALHAPRSMQVNRSGKLSISFRRSLRTTKNGGVVFPQDKFDGVPGQFFRDLKGTIFKHFAPKLSDIIERYG